jgi:hypothetical protein
MAEKKPGQEILASATEKRHKAILFSVWPLLSSFLANETPKKAVNFFANNLSAY